MTDIEKLLEALRKERTDHKETKLRLTVAQRAGERLTALVAERLVERAALVDALADRVAIVDALLRKSQPEPKEPDHEHDQTPTTQGQAITYRASDPAPA